MPDDDLSQRVDSTLDEDDLILSDMADACLAEPVVESIAAAPPPTPVPVGPCNLCGHVWIPRAWTIGPPKSCARCRSLRWDQPLRPGQRPPIAWLRHAHTRATHTRVARDSYRRRRFRELVTQLGRDVCLELLGAADASVAIATTPDPAPIPPRPPEVAPTRPIGMPPPPRLTSPNLLTPAELLATLEPKR